MTGVVSRRRGPLGFAIFTLAAGVVGGWLLSAMLVKVLTGVFDPPPPHLFIPWAYLAALAVAGFGSGLLDVAPAAMIGDIIDRDGGTVVASYQMAGDVGSVVGPVAGGFLVDSASYGAAFGLAAAVLGGIELGAFEVPARRLAQGGATEIGDRRLKPTMLSSMKATSSASRPKAP